MKHVSELKRTLSQYLDWNKARISCLAQILQGIFCVKTVNLAQISSAFHTNAKEESSYRRIRRFFKDYVFDIGSIVPLILQLFTLEGKFVLILDRTNWKWGKNHINILMLSVAFFGIGIPLFWTVLDSGGTSSTSERIAMMMRVIKRFGSEKIEALLADREFIGEEWFRFLIEGNIPFVIRIKQGFLAGGIRSSYQVPIRELWKYDKRRKRIINHVILLWGLPLYASIRRRKDAKEPMIVVSNRKYTDPIRLYKRRWEIETLFSCLKSRGFRLEDTHITAPERIEKLLFVLAIAFCWAYKTGIIEARKNRILIRTHKRKSISHFRLGFNLIRSAIFTLVKKIDCFLRVLRLLKGLKSDKCVI